MGSLNIQLASDHLLINSQKELIIVNIQGPTQALALPSGTCAEIIKKKRSHIKPTVTNFFVKAALAVITCQP